ncbi:MAG: molybdopterin-dependent oxidoreductase [Coriobacteriales bacterium]|nr:molybdopterin-dependent oxidoreductase [Coriobacteriales bacterium]
MSAACWHNCGGRCVNKVLVQDGVIVRQKTDDTHEDSMDYPQQRACVRGRSQRNQVLATDRLKFPMKRKGWQPGGGVSSNGQMRGNDEWERISWDEAIQYIADEVKRVVDAYGNRSIFGLSGSVCSRVFASYGGFIPRWGTTSQGSWTYTPRPMGNSNSGNNDRFDFYNCDYVVLGGENPVWSSAGLPGYFAKGFKDAGVKFIGIDPFYNDTYALLDAEWIPIRPSTDTALYLGIAHAMLALDATEQLIDWDFLDRCTLGFDAEHMPEGEDPNGNFRDYVLGTYDGIPKTAEWASEICGVAPEDIEKLARILGKDNKVALLAATAAARTQSSDALPQVFLTIGMMGGHYGKSGHMCGANYHSNAFTGGPSIVSPGSNGLESIKNPLAEGDTICDAEVWRAIVSGTYTMAGVGTKKQPGVEKDVDIKIIYHDNRALLQTCDGQTTGIEAHRKVDLVVSHAMFMTTNAAYSDIVLPLTSYWEREGGFLTGNREMVIVYSKIMDPLYECKSDDEIAYLLAGALGLDPEEVYPISEKQRFMNEILGCVTTESGEEEPLVSVTADDLSAWGCEGEPQEGKIALADFIAQGVYQVPRKAGDQFDYIAYKKFVEDPEANPLESESGKMEIYCRKLRDDINGIGYSTIEAIPTYTQPPEGFEATFSDWGSKAKGEFPYQVYNPHYLRRSHTVFDNVQWLREAWPNPVFVSATDAREKGVASGDVVLLTSKHGRTLRTACVTERFMPGVIGLPHGAWVSIDPSTGIDTAGSDNILTGVVPTGQGTSGWNTCVCNMEKYTGAALAPDVEVALRILAAQMA